MKGIIKVHGQSAVAAPNEKAGRRRVIFQQYILHYPGIEIRKNFYMSAGHVTMSD